ncbi:hypothetical protein Glove_627g5 [Diversispora epigaea]|uniref:Uncharacterized protein n=1 Tax=Diversispora epigaea TaxID=1348612 RepID=A0A397G8D8_9GLOM|nr:hypothetical protein Glove_627g5 [Diversispora epigaea]
MAEFVIKYLMAKNEVYKLLNNQKLNYMENFILNNSTGGQKIICAESLLYQQCNNPLDDNAIAFVNKLLVPQKDSSLKEETQSHELPKTILESDNNKTDINIIPSDNIPSNVLPKAKEKKYINCNLIDKVLK